MAAAAVFDFEKLMLFLNYLTDQHQTWWRCYDIDVEHIFNTANHVFAEFKMAAAAI
jgi:hypothetical protein